MQIKCPVCSKKTSLKNNQWRPFCSERCKLIDLGKWALEEYTIAGQDFKEKEDLHKHD